MRAPWPIWRTHLALGVVNEAARLTEVAKERDGCVVASGAALSRASDDGASRWTALETQTLRGGDEVTELAVPSGHASCAGEQDAQDDAAEARSLA